MPRLPERLPAPLSERIAGASSAIFNRMGQEVDVAVGAIPFRLATYSEAPQSIETVQVRKDQFDAERDPGEQSLSGWWRRSQSSFHEGAGFLYEPDSDDAFNGFWDSSGVDVFTKGQLSLLRRLDTYGAVANLTRIRANTGGNTAVAAGDLYHHTGGAWAVLHNPASRTVLDGFITGSNFLSVASDGTNSHLYSGTIASPGTATTWPLAGPANIMEWGLHRLWLISAGRSIWQPNLSLAGGTTQNPIYTHPDPGWTYTCLAEAPDAMLFGGHNGRRSSIHAISLDSTGGLPTLTGARVVAVLPDGELVKQVATLAGQYVGIGTTQGFRVGLLGQNGAITFGPLLFEGEVSAIAPQGRFFVVATNVAGQSARTYRVDTGTQLDELIFPYARDVEDPAVTHFNSLAAETDKILLATTAAGSTYRQSTSNTVTSGWIQSTRIRYRTTEPKSYKYLGLEIQPLVGAIQVDLILEGGSTLPLGSVTQAGEVLAEDFTIHSEPMPYASVKLTLTPSGGVSPVVNSFLLRALPAVKPQRLVTLPLLCFNDEQARSGQRYGADTYAMDRLAALHLLEDTAETVVYQDFTSGDSTGRLVVIESVRYIQTAPADEEQGPGGTIILQLRTVD